MQLQGRQLGNPGQLLDSLGLPSGYLVVCVNKALMRKSTRLLTSPRPFAAGALAFAFALAAMPAWAQDRTCARLKALALAATMGFPKLSGPVVTQDVSGTTIAPTQDLLPMLGECRLQTPAQADHSRATLTCETPLRQTAGPNVVEDLYAAVVEFGICLGAGVSKQSAGEQNEPGRVRAHTWTLTGPAESPWVLTFSLLEPDTQGASVPDRFPGHLEMRLSSTPTSIAPVSSK